MQMVLIRSWCRLCPNPRSDTGI